jgi:hypothetical protein
MTTRLSRRTMLRGLGTGIALPLLDAMGSTAVAAPSRKAAVPVRMAFLYVPNGIHMPDWTPADTGSAYKLPPTLEPLADLRGDFSILTGLGQRCANSNGDGPGDHARAMASFLSGVQARKTEGLDIECGTTVDQIAASAIGRRTRFPSLEIGADRGKSSGTCDSGYSCVYSSTISWRTESQPLPKENDPKVIFERLFENGRPGESAQARAKRDRFSRSILDFALEDARRLERSLGASDRRKLDEYLSAIREVEQRIERSNRANAAGVAKVKKPDGIPQDYEQHLRLLADLLVLAFQTDSTRIATFVFANEGSGRSYPSVEVPEGHHDLSHHGNDPAKQAKLGKINRFHTRQLAYFLGRLKSAREADSNLLDRSMILYGGCIGDGNRHDHNHLPILLAGRAGGTLSPGRHQRYETKTPLNNLFSSLLDRIGAQPDALPETTGRLEGI